MDLRELVRAHSEPAVGHRPVRDSLNVRLEFKRFASDSITPLIRQSSKELLGLIKYDIERYNESYFGT